MTREKLVSIMNTPVGTVADIFPLLSVDRHTTYPFTKPIPHQFLHTGGFFFCRYFCY